MSSRVSHRQRRHLRRTILMPLVASLMVQLPLAPCLGAQEFGASTPPKGAVALKVFPKIFFAAAYFEDDGRAFNLPETTGIRYIEFPVQVQYGLTGSLALGAIVPFGWTHRVQSTDPTEEAVIFDRFTVREFWVTLQHRWWTLPFISSSALHVKIPLADKEPWEDGLRVGDGQVDIYPQYYFEYLSKTHYWFTELNVGYKYRFADGGEKPFDELIFKAVLGLEFWDSPKIEGFLFADLTQFRNGDCGETPEKFFRKEGSLQTFGYGTSFEPFPLMQIYMHTAGDLRGRNQYRGMRWTVGFRRVFG